MNLISQHKTPIAVAKGWRVLQLDSGKVVYHNAVTNQSQWELPAELRRAMDEQQHINTTPSRAAGGASMHNASGSAAPADGGSIFASVLGSPTAITPSGDAYLFRHLDQSNARTTAN